MNFEPLADRVAIERDSASDTITESGILIPGRLKETPSEGTVIAVGPKAAILKAGDRILFGKYTGVEVKVGDKTLILLREEEVLGRLIGGKL